MTGSKTGGRSPSSECPPASPSQATNLYVTMVFKNSGDADANNTVVEQHLSIDGIAGKADSLDTPTTISPGQRFEITFETGMMDYQAIVNGLKELKNKYEVRYNSKFEQVSQCFQTTYRARTKTMEWLNCD
jgi:hypothetical protein